MHNRLKRQHKCKRLPFSRQFQRNAASTSVRLLFGPPEKVLPLAHSEYRNGYADVLALPSNEALDAFDFSTLVGLDVMAVQKGETTAFTPRELLACLARAGCPGGCIITEHGMGRDEAGRFLYFGGPHHV